MEWFIDLEIQKLDRKTKERARIMYLGDYDMFDICETLSVDMDTLRFYVFGENGAGTNEHCWHAIKKAIGPTSVAIYVKDKISVLDKTAGIALSIVTESLSRLQRQMQEDEFFMPSVDDIKKLSGIVTEMDKMVRLESGTATDIIDNIQHMSVADARRILTEDPFAPGVMDAEFEDVTPDNTPDSIMVDPELKEEEKPWQTKSN